MSYSKLCIAQLHAHHCHAPIPKLSNGGISRDLYFICPNPGDDSMLQILCDFVERLQNNENLWNKCSFTGDK